MIMEEKIKKIVSKKCGWWMKSKIQVFVCISSFQKNSVPMWESNVPFDAQFYF